METDACGNNFKAYQYDAIECSEDSKCGKQVQEQEPAATKEGHFMGVIRSCYRLGSLPMNESNGCHLWFNPLQNFTALYCFCDENYCNAATATIAGLGPATDPFTRLLYFLALMVALLFPSVSSSPSSWAAGYFLACVDEGDEKRKEEEEEEEIRHVSSSFSIRVGSGADAAADLLGGSCCGSKSGEVVGKKRSSSSGWEASGSIRKEEEEEEGRQVVSMRQYPGISSRIEHGAGWFPVQAGIRNLASSLSLKAE